MKRLFAVIAVLLMLMVPVAVFADSAESESEPLVRLSAVISMGSPEGVAITNFGDTSVNLADYSLYDGEGTVVFADRLLPFQSTLYILSGVPDDRFGDIECIYDGKGCTFSNFQLNNKGDDIYLKHGDAVIDVFCYGTVAATEGWSGDPFPALENDCGAFRVSSVDGDTYDDWSTHSLGIIQHLMVVDGFDAVVEPFVFPDSRGHPVMRALSEATESVDISIYLLSYPSVISIILGLIDRGVDVRILAEGEPVGGLNSTSVKALVTLSDAGADVKVTKSVDGKKLFTNLHSKYAVVDDEKVIITSENWVESSFTSNRGWGAVVTSEAFAGYYGTVFEEDFGNDVYTVDVRAAYPDSKTSSYRCKEDYSGTPVTYTATVYPVLSPDNSWNLTKDMITSAEGYIYAEQLNLTFSWTNGGDNPLQWMVSNTADARLLINSSHDDKDKRDPKGAYAAIDKMDGNGIRMRTLEGVTVHNKGMVADDLSWVGSVNWTQTSFNKNREAAVIIESVQVADFYKGFFLTDWGGDLAMVEVDYPSQIYANSPFVLDMNVSNDLDVQWDLDDDGIMDMSGSEITVTLPAGEHEVTAYVDGDPVFSTVLTVKDDDGGSSGNDYTLYIVIGAIGAAAVCAVAFILIRRR